MGNKISEKLDGMFAFAIFDKIKKYSYQDHGKTFIFHSNGEFIYFDEIRPLKF